MRRRFAPLLATVVLAAGAASAAHGADQHLYTGAWPYEASLKYGNGNKIVVGKLNSLHVVWADADSGDIGYGYSIDIAGTPEDEGGGNSWDQRWWNPGAASMPTIAVDSTGKAHVVWILSANAEGVGKMFYTRQTQIGCVSNWCWTAPLQISASASEPSLVAQGAQLHLTWTNRYQVRYATWAAAAPPTGTVLGEIVHYSTCPETRFHQPSVAVVNSTPCQITPKIAFLVAAKEPQTFGLCVEGAQVGPRVFSRNMNNGVWNPVADFLTPLAPYSETDPDPVAFSLSLASNPGSQSLYLAWSDELGGSVRTLTTYSRGNAWVWGTPVPLSSQKRYVHVRGRNSSAGQFRIAASGPANGAYPQLTPSIWHGTGKWSNPSAPTFAWLEAPIFMTSTNFPEGLSPQGIFWQKCSGASPRELKAYGVFSDGSWPDLMLYETAPCTTPPVNDSVLMYLCEQAQHHKVVSLGRFVVYGTVRDMGSALDFGDGVVTALHDKGATVRTAEGGRMQVVWPSGKVLSSWENGFFVSAPAETLRVTSDIPYTIEDLGTLENEPPAPPRK